MCKQCREVGAPGEEAYRGRSSRIVESCVAWRGVDEVVRGGTRWGVVGRGGVGGEGRGTPGGGGRPSMSEESRSTQRRR